VVISTLLAGLAALTALVFVELRQPAPMLNLRLLRNRIFRTTSLVFVLSQCAYTGYLFVMPEFLQLARGDTALASGLTTLPGAVGLWINSQFAARVYPRAGPRRMAVLAMAGVTLIFCLFGLTMGVTTNTWLIRVLIFCSGSSIAWCGLAVQAASFSTISSADTGRAAALFNTQTQAAGGIGVATLVTVVSSVRAGVRAGSGGAALVPAFHHAFLTAAGFIVAAGLVALTIRDADAAASMRRRGAAAAPEPDGVAAAAAAVEAITAEAGGPAGGPGLTGAQPDGCSRPRCAPP
jgi:MFS family permease